MVFCDEEGCSYYGHMVNAPEGYDEVATYSSETYSSVIFSKGAVTEEVKHASLEISKLLHKRASEDDQKLETAVRSVVNVIGITFHDMRNILGSISGIVQLMELDLAENDDLLSSIHEIAAVVDRFEATSRNTMKLYRNERIHYSEATVPVSELYKTLLEKRKRVFSLSNIALIAHVEEGLTADVDERYVAMFMNELLSNAFDAFDEDGADGGEISVSVTRENKFCNLTVVDKGEGIPYDLQRHILKLFVTTKNKRRGTGLSEIARCLNDWGGSLSFTSTPGQGSSFTVKFPFVL